MGELCGGRRTRLDPCDPHLRGTRVYNAELITEPYPEALQRGDALNAKGSVESRLFS